jgi:UDP-N-acetylmuramoyl-L-alanyl-D-glutamate--2,6-diaminopimelate ligase
MMSVVDKCRIRVADLLADLVTEPVSSELWVTGLTLDSRQVREGDGFIALKGSLTNGVDYIEQAVDRGAEVILVDAEAELDAKLLALEAPLFRIQNLAAQVSEIAGRFYHHPSRQMKLVAFTGTNGKTTCSRLYAQLLANLSVRSAFIGTTGFGMAQTGGAKGTAETTADDWRINSGLTTPDAVTMQRILAELSATGAQQIALEASSHSLVQQRIAALEIDTAVFTNLSRDHLDYHGDLDRYAAAKASLFSMPGVKHAVINRDDVIGRRILAGLNPAITALTFSLENPAADIYCSQITASSQLNAPGLRATIHTPWGREILESSLFGTFNLLNLLAVIGVAGIQGIELSEILRAIAKLSAVLGRMEVITADGKPVVVVDYAHTPDALENALLALRPHCAGQLHVIFGCGGDRDVGKRPLMGEIARRCADRVVVTSDNPRSESPQQIADDILQGIQAEVEVELDRRQAIANCIGNAAAQDIILIAGKGHENYQILGGDRLPFSDQLEARLALRGFSEAVLTDSLGGVSL